ncbi:MAG: integrase arm-type DNA-binding domain-containing protein [Rhizobium sp.]
MAKALTVRSVEAEKPGPSRREIPDGHMPGLFLIIQPTGGKSWAVRYRHGARTRKLTIGAFPAFGLADARKAAGDALRAVAEGRDPALEKSLQKAEQADESNLVKNVLARYDREYLQKHNRPNTIAAARSVFKNRLQPAWGSRLISSITRADVKAIRSQISAEGLPAAEIRTLAVMSKFFAWCSDKELVEVSPMIGVKPESKAKPRKRFLSDAEIRLFWLACKKVGWPFGPFGQLLLLTGQRREEVSAATWAEIDLKARVWRIPESRAKNGEAHEVPLSFPVVDLLDALPTIDGGNQYVLTTGKSYLQTYSRAKSSIDAAMLEIARAEAEKREEDPELVSIAPWTFHDLRRTLSTGLHELGIAPHIVEAILNHVSGHRAGVAGTYNRATYAHEKGRALKIWADHVLHVAEGRALPNNVEPIRAVS